MVTFWHNRSVLLTGHTGFKGSWLALWLTKLGARVHGYALAPPTSPNLFEAMGLATQITSHHHGDVRDAEHLRRVFSEIRPELVFHLAAQPLVQFSYHEPVTTFDTNVMGTIQVLEAVRQCQSVRVVQVITSDKCYSNQEWDWAYRETDPLGGHDPYSASKGAQELVAASWRSAFFRRERPELSLATCRSGNVIGGGDWAENRILPDCIRALERGETIRVRNPAAIRPWQHVLDPLSGYLLLACQQWEHPRNFDGAWNFGPGHIQPITVANLVEQVCAAWGGGQWETVPLSHHYPENHLLRLETSKANLRLRWFPVLSIEESVALTIDWYRDRFQQGTDFDAMATCIKQIAFYEAKKS